MKTPDGKECRYYYEDFHRGRNRQECRLLLQSQQAAKWRPTDCLKCTVPGILQANASEYLELKATLRQGVMGIGRHIEVHAACRRHKSVIDDPYVGCAECTEERSDLSVFFQPDDEEN